MPILNIAVVFTALSRTKQDNVLREFADIMPRYEIDSALRVCHFLAQLAHESAGFTRTEENLNYSKQALLSVFGRHFTPETAEMYARKPEQIANIVYANRLGNGGATSGDGWKYRGRSFIQLTFKGNYSKYSQLIFDDDRLVENPDLALNPKIAVLIACEFWKANSLNTYADRDDLDAISDKINLGHLTRKYGDSNGFSDRKSKLLIAKKSIGI